jgi:hypothetical membrane protein
MNMEAATKVAGKRSKGGLLFGPLAALILAAGVAGLPCFVPGYDSLRQTVSEIGEVGSPAQIPFTATLLIVAACLLGFAVALRNASRDAQVSAFPAYLVACSSISAAGVGWFAYPHPLHNVFGPSELIGYQAPLAFALAWRRAPRARSLVAFSSTMAILLWLAIIANLGVFDRHGAIWAYERSVYGVIQRALFVAYFCWCTGAGLWLYRR